MAKTRLWSKDPSVLLESPLEFVYSKDFDRNRNTNAMVRFVLYWTALAFAIKPHVTILLLSAAIQIMLRGKDEPERIGATESTRYCQAPSLDNPMANATPFDWGSGDSKLPACPSYMVQDRSNELIASQPITGPVYALGGRDEGSRLAERTFFSVPTSGVPDGRESFVHALYGSGIERSIK